LKRGKLRIGYVGWVGHDNLGDEASFLTVKSIFSEYDLIPDVFQNYRRHYSGITLFGGGTLLPNWIPWTRPNRYNYIFGTGVKSEFDPFDSLNEKLFFSLGIERLRNFSFRLAGVRDPNSKERLRLMGVDSEVIGDPCLLLEANSYEKREDAKIGVNVGSSISIYGNDEKRVLHEVTELCRLLERNGFHVVLIPFSRDDVPMLKSIRKKSDVDICWDWTNIQNVLNSVASCQILIGERLHSLVFSAATYTPFVSIAYRSKCRDFAESVGFDEYIVGTDKISSRATLMMIYSLLDNWDEMQRLLIQNVKMYRKKLKNFAATMKSDMSKLPDDKWSALSPGLLNYLRWSVMVQKDKFLYYHAKKIWQAQNSKK
jgi:hypothetical protein